MAQLLEQPRYKCALGAMHTVHAIPGAIPILHSGPGCGTRLSDFAGTSGHYSFHIFPCSSLSEKEVVFGGEPRLHETVKNALKIIDAQLYVVMTGCTSEIIGDDVEAVVGEFQTAEKDVVFANTPGFKGSNYQGHDWVQKAIFEQYLSADPHPLVEKGLINLFAGPPMQDPFWLGNLRVLEELLREIGLTPNTIFGHGRGLDNVRRLPHAEFNLLVTPWVGLESLQFLSERYNTPLLHYPVLPIGAFETSKFLRAVAEFTGADSHLVEQVIKRHEDEYYYYIERYADIFLEARIMSKRFVAVSDAQYALAITKFMVNDLGKFPVKQFVTDATPPEHQKAIEAEFKDLNYGIEAEVAFQASGFEIHREIQDTDFGGPAMIFGSSYESALADKIKGYNVIVSYPIIERLIINGALAGYHGGLKLLEDMYTAALVKFALAG
jgi:nitrogenase molybdenum-iron protein beta chain